MLFPRDAGCKIIFKSYICVSLDELDYKSGDY